MYDLFAVCYRERRNIRTTVTTIRRRTVAEVSQEKKNKERIRERERKREKERERERERKVRRHYLHIYARETRRKREDEQGRMSR